MKLIVIGAGIGGLTTALLLATDGHEVTVLERDPAPAPDPDEAWDDWSRRGVNQFRLPHFFLPRYRSIIESELPGLTAPLENAGMLRFNIIKNIPEEMSGGFREGDDAYELITGRRSIFEAVVAAFADETSGLTVRRGTAVEELITGPPTSAGVPHVTGVRTSDRENPRRRSRRRRDRETVTTPGMAGRGRCRGSVRRARGLRVHLLRTPFPIRRRRCPGDHRSLEPDLRLDICPHPPGRQRNLGHRLGLERAGRGDAKAP